MYDFLKKCIFSKKINLLVILLYPFSLFTHLFVIIKNIYFSNPKHQISIKNALVISIGNLTLGGSGKTPFTQYLATYFSQQDFSVKIITKMYKSKLKTNKVLSISHKTLSSKNLDLLSDETILLAKNCPNAIIYSAQKKWKCAKKISNELTNSTHKNIVVLVDDGFSHRKIKRDIDFVLIDSELGFGNGFLFPAGSLREPISNKKRATSIISKGKSNITELSFDYQLRSIISSKGIFEKKNLNHQKILLVSGISNPKSFENIILKNKLSFDKHIVYDDHHNYLNADIRLIRNTIENEKYNYLITTEKDWVKLMLFEELKPYLLCVKIGLIFLGDTEKKIKQALCNGKSL